MRSILPPGRSPSMLSSRASMTAMISSNSPNPSEATERLLERLSRTDNNADFLSTLSRQDA